MTSRELRERTRTNPLLAGISIAVVNPRAWSVLADNPGAPRNSILSLLDWEERWLDTDRTFVPTILAPLEVWALKAAIERVKSEGLTSVERRHRAAAAASRAGVRALGLAPFVDDAEAAVIVTTLRSPDGLDATSLVSEAKRRSDVALSPGFGDLAHEVIRVDHTGERARLDVVIAALQALGAALGRATSDEAIAAALDAASKAWSDEIFVR